MTLRLKVFWFQNPQVWEMKSRLFDVSSLRSFSLSHSGRGRSGGQSSLRARAGGSVRRAERERKRERAGRSKRARRQETESSNSSGNQQASKASKDSERAKRARQRERGEQAKRAGKRRRESAWSEGPSLVGYMRMTETEGIRTQFRHTEEHTPRGRVAEPWPKVETEPDKGHGPEPTQNGQKAPVGQEGRLCAL